MSTDWFDGRIARRSGSSSLARIPARPRRRQGARAGDADRARRPARVPGLDGRRDRRPRDPDQRPAPGGARTRHCHRCARPRQAQDLVAGYRGRHRRPCSCGSFHHAVSPGGCCSSRSRSPGSRGSTTHAPRPRSSRGRAPVRRRAGATTAPAATLARERHGSTARRSGATTRDGEPRDVLLRPLRPSHRRGRGGAPRRARGRRRAPLRVGHGAATAVVFAFAAPGSTIALAEGAYFGTSVLLRELERWGIDSSSTTRRGRPPAADIVWVESPANPTLTTPDWEALRAHRRARRLRRDRVDPALPARTRPGRRDRHPLGDEVPHRQA